MSEIAIKTREGRDASIPSASADAFSSQLRGDLVDMVVYPMAQAREVLRFYRDFAAQMPDEAEASAFLATSPENEPIVALVLGYYGGIEQGEKTLAPAREFGTPLAYLVQPMPYAARNTIQDDPNATHGIQRYWKSGFTEIINDDLIEVLADAAADFLSPLTAMSFSECMGRRHGSQAGPRHLDCAMRSGTSISYPSGQTIHRPTFKLSGHGEPGIESSHSYLVAPT